MGSGESVVRDAAKALLENPARLDGILTGIPLVSRLTLETKLMALAAVAAPKQPDIQESPLVTQLTNLMCEAFTDEEGLKRFVHWFTPGGYAVYAQLPADARLPDRIKALVKIWDKNGTFRLPEFWSALLRERPRWAHGINSCRSLVK